MRIFKYILFLIAGLILWFVVDFSFSFQQLSIIFFLSSVLYLLAGTFIEFKYCGKQKIINSILLLIPQFLFVFVIAILNKALFPIFTPGIFVICLLNFIIGSFIVYKFRGKKFLSFMLIIGWLFLIFIAGFKMIPQLEYSNNSYIENKQLIPYKLISLKKDTLLSDQCINKVVVLDFWSTRCGICYRLFPKIEELANYYKENKNVMIIAVNDGTVDSVSRFFDAKGIDKYTFPFMYDIGKSLNKDLNIQGYPVTFIFDKKGNLRYRHNGCGKDEILVLLPKLIEQIDFLLSE
jgi:thiol-disulfide isomerase/thioredoxin